MLKIGDKAPDFSLLSSDGKKYKLQDLLDKKLILYFYPKDNTSGCTKEACIFQNTLATIKKREAHVVGVSADSLASHIKYSEKYGLTFLLLSDEKKSVLRAYGVWKKKSLYGRKYFGIERTTFIIDQHGIIRHIFRKVKVDNHRDEILAVL